MAAAAAAGTVTTPAPEAVEKQADARTIMVIGDFLASGLAEGLDNAFSQNATVRILDRSKGNSGFVRDDVYDWPKEIGALIDTEKPAAIAIMMGSNDRQALRIDGHAEDVRSDAWNKAYEARTEALAETIQARKIPFVWVSVPAFKSAKMTSDMLAFNTVYKTASEAAGGDYVDIWDGFVDENGAFVMSGPDVNGQMVRLRSGEGINLTDAGKAKLAFYAEKPLRKLLGLAPDDIAPRPNLIPSPSTEPGKPVPRDRTDPIALDDPNLDGSDELLGGPTAPPPSPSPSQPPAPAGRADNFGGPSRASSAAAAAPILPPEPTAAAQ